MNQTITAREQETLSAYLDNALNPRERQRLETQLQTRPDLRAALNDLRHTRQLLRQTPVLRAPRNFTLTPEMAGLRTQPPRLYPVFRLAFTLASILFVLVVGGEVFLRGPAASPASDVAMVPAAEMFALVATPMEGMTQTLPMNDSSGQRNGYVPPQEESALGTTAAEDGGTGSAEIAPSESPTPGNFMVAAETPTPTIEQTYKSEPTAEIIEETVPSLEEPITTTVNLLPPDATLESGEMERAANDAPSPDIWASPWRVLQVILGIIVLTSAVGLLLFRRKTLL